MSNNYPVGADIPSAPWNQEDKTPVDVKMYIIQTLSKSTVVNIEDYIDNGVEYDFDEDGSYMCGWGGYQLSSDINWNNAFTEEHYTALDLIHELKTIKEKELKELELELSNTSDDIKKHALLRQIKHTKYLISECDGWKEDDVDMGEI